MSDIHKNTVSGYFHIPNVSLFTEGNTYIGSENTFNFRITPDGETLRSCVWYGMKCFELSEIVSEHESEKTAEGLSDAGAFIDREYDIYNEKLASGEVAGRRTYKAAGGSSDSSTE